MTTGKGVTGIEYNQENSRTVSYSILLFILCRVEAGGCCEVGMTTKNERWKK